MHELVGVSLLLDDARVGLLTERHTWHDARAWVSTCYITVYYDTVRCHAIDTINHVRISLIHELLCHAAATLCMLLPCACSMM
jgi:hypothetical protein